MRIRDLLDPGSGMEKIDPGPGRNIPDPIQRKIVNEKICHFPRPGAKS